ncbi:MAG TPA: response regulator [Opitutaceae bacterium]|nr:response regulator [Opitutaceae bacterium]
METLTTNDRPLHILHLEDSVPDRALIQETLRGNGLACEFKCVASRVEFEAALAAERFDVIISDYSLPGYDGAEALAATRRIDSSVPFLFVSGTIGDERAVESLRSGATDYVLKDNLARLEPAVSRALRDAEEQRRRRVAEEARLAAESRFREMADTIREVFRVTTSDGRQVTYINPACEKVFGRPVAAFEGNAEGWLDAVHPEDRARVAETLKQLARGQEFEIEYRVVHPDGTVRHIEDHCYPVINSAGVTERAVGVAVDCTERKRLLQQLLESQRMEAVGQLAGGIAHDFNNLITVIKGHLGILESNQGLPPFVADSLRQIGAASDRAASLTNQLLLFSRKQVPRPHTIDLTRIIRDLIPMLRPTVGQHIDILEPSATGPVLIDADPGMVDQVLTNLAFNARDAMREGGRLSISAVRAPRDIRVPSGQNGGAPFGYACVSVSDSGTGIPPEVLPKIFEPFFTTKPVGKGTGLGLASVFGIVKQHKGWIEVDSKVGRGTTFNIYLPASAEKEAGSHETPPAHRKAGSHETILLVEDEAPVRALVQAVLELEGYRVFAAENGRVALELWEARKAEIQMLLTDIVMPGGLTGIDVANRLVAERPELPVLYISGYAPEYARKRFRIGVDVNFLEKPFEISNFRQTVRKILDSAPVATA